MTMSRERFRHYTINIESIDQGHWELCQGMDQCTALAKAGEVEKLFAAVPLLQAALIKHFEHEEVQMVANNYPFLRAHQDEHARMLEQIKNFAIKLEKKQFMSYYFPNELENLFLHHIDYADRSYGDYIEKMKK